MAERKYFGKFRDVIEAPPFIEPQIQSYAEFLQADVPPNRRKNVGLQAVFKEVFPIESYDGQATLDCANYEIGETKTTWLDCLREGITYSAPLHVTFRLKDSNGTKEEKVYMGEIPLMTPSGSLVINGAERVIVSQLHRSPGICFEQSVHTSGKLLYGFRIIPDRGTWLECQFDNNDLLNVYLDRRHRRRKFLATMFLRALGYGTDEAILKLFYAIEEVKLKDFVSGEESTNKVLIADVMDAEKQLVVARAFEPLTKVICRQLIDMGIDKVKVVDTSIDDGCIVKCIRKDPCKNTEEALKEIYRRLRPGDPPTVANANALIKRLFFDPRRYDLGRVGRYKINQKLNRNVDLESRVLEKEDLIEAVRYLLALRKGEGSIDDIDHLGSRRLRTVGELLANQCRVGLARTERVVKERMTLFDVSTDTMTPQVLVNPKALSAVIRDFFGRSQLSQFMDQTNPLSELTHKRRLSALGPGGLSRERAGFEVRDVHPSHYGRICPIETPEGPNIGLISAMSIYARINEFGFMETPYRKVKDGRVSDQVDYLTADQEENYVVAQANAPIDDRGHFTVDKVSCRYKSDFIEVDPERVHYMDVSPKQLVSVAAGLIPFLNDDANRALMGSNMQRQAVPLLQEEAPFVGTGLEGRIARDSKVCVIADESGVVASVTGQRIIVTKDGELPEGKRKIVTDPENHIWVYELRKFMRSNAGTCFNQKPIVKRGEKVKKNQVLADGPCCDHGELALGRNVLVAFMPWCGYNFEDAILVNERLVKEDVYTSIHIDEFEVGARDTKLGPEEITRDIPNVGEEALNDLGHDGVIRVGAEIKPGDILVGKITPKGETELAPEERLLRAIFGEKAADVKDTSLRVPSGTYGIVMDVKVSSRKEPTRPKLTATEVRRQKKQIEDEYKTKSTELREGLTEKLSNVLLGEKIPLDVVNAETGEIIIPANRKITKTLLRKLATVYDHVEIDPSPIRIKIREIIGEFEHRFSELEMERDRKLDQIESGEDVEAGIIKQVKVYIASKRKLSVGDKMAGRHGNKGVVAKIVPEQDMPFLPDGTAVDIVLNPLGVPSRMNVGQVLETHLGVAAKALGFNIASPVFDGVTEDEIRDMIKDAKKVDGFSWVSEHGKCRLYDGRTGETFDQEVVVGYIYMMKLGHLVADKIHARAVGPYSLVTQQPLGGKAQYGGQRFGEMEVWAMEAYGAAYTLQELMTVKSDDVQGRTRIYESIVKGDNTLEAGTPESFNVLMKEMQSLCLDVRVGKDGGGKQFTSAAKTAAAIPSAAAATAAARAALGLEKTDVFDHVSIGIASPETIRSWSHGEVKNPETINYRTFKPEKGGLFCERIFGPVRDWECNCGKYKRIKHRGVICDRCGVEVTVARVRRERMGHIELAVPVSHIWFFKAMPSRMGLMLDMTARDLERVLYYEDYIVIDEGKTPLKPKQLLTEMEYREAREQYGDGFVAKMGAEAVKELLTKIDLRKLAHDLEHQLDSTKSKQLRKKIAKRLKLAKGFLDAKMRPEWMVLEVLPVIPPDLRPLVPLEGGRFATSDLNDLYRRVINRNNRLKNLLQLKTPDVIIRNEKRMLQEAVDALLDNGRHGRPVTGAGGRALKSLADMLKGKQGRFRQNLLGKRVDYSGRSVIVIGPELKLNQCGLPKKMALVLFEPFIIRRLREMDLVHTIRSAKKLIERQSPEVWDILEEVSKGHPVLLNRAPTLHRLSIQAFEPLLIEGDAIRIHPLVCTAYNADFDGDQMAVHVPLSVEAQLEARLLMLATNNIFSPSSGKPITTPTQDIALGTYYLTHGGKQDRNSGNKRLKLFADAQEVFFARDESDVGIHEHIRLKNPDYGSQTVYGDPVSKTIETTIGRVAFNEIWPAEVGFYNRAVDKSKLSDIIWQCYRTVGHDRTVEVLDKLKALGFESATRAGISIGIEDMIVPKEKTQVIEESLKDVAEVEKQYRRGIITDGERYNKIIDIWTHATDKISNLMYATMEHNGGKPELNPVFIMVDSKARGSRQQIRQLAGMRGLMAKPSGEIIERPILANFREGLSVLEYFISTHGARKGLADTALKTADAGYLTRKLVDVAQDVIILEEDCGTVNGIWVKPIFEGEDEVVKLSERIIGRIAAEDITDPVSHKAIVKANTEIDEAAAEAIARIGIEKVKIRSVLTCESRRGVCAMCYGRNLATSKPVKVGEAVGIIAAQSIGEPGTQLTMRTFHIGGTASQVFKQPQIKAKNDGIVRYHDVRAVRRVEGNWVVLNKNGQIALYNQEGRELERYSVVIGAEITVADGASVKKGDTFVQWDPYNVPVLCEVAGTVKFHDIVEGITMRRELDEATGLMGTVVIEHKEDLHPQINIVNDAGEVLAFYGIPAGAHIIVNEGDKIQAGALVAKTPRKVFRTKDITGGLPRVAELFEARRPKDAAEIAKIDGVVDFSGTVRGKRRILVKDPKTSAEEEHLIPHSKHIIVFRGDTVKKGQQLTEGPVVPHEVLEVCGPQDLQEYLVNEVQEVYRLQGVEINDKHIEIIVRQMLRKVRVVDPGDTRFLWDDQVDKITFEEENRRVAEAGGKPAEAQPVLLGITKASLGTESFISAASFQDTTRILTEAATLGRVDHLRGFKENVIMGHLIPAGTGYYRYRNVRLVPLAEPVEQPELPEPLEQKEEKPTEEPAQVAS